jgi:uncharacterized protein (DUF2141 family)
MKKIMLMLSLMLMFFGTSADENKGDLTVVINGLKIEGTVYVSLFNQPDGYPTKAEKAFKKDMKKVASKQEKIVFKNLPHGTYAASVWHDENDNGKMETSLIGIPREGTGASNNAKGKMGPPKFADASFKVDKKSNTISITVNY